MKAHESFFGLIRRIFLKRGEVIKIPEVKGLSAGILIFFYLL
jgi:hypothetical protein